MDETTSIKLLEQHGIKPTSNRIVVLKALAAECHPTSTTDLEHSILTIDKSGIFRCLVLFREHHLVHSIEDGEGGLKYELCHSHGTNDDDDLHVHFFCERCHRIFCLHDTPMPQLAVPEGYIIHSSNYLLKGICADCASKEVGKR